MDDKDIQQIKKDLSIIRSTLMKMDKSLYTNTKDLAEHMRRTNMLEQEAKLFKAHMEQVKGAGKLLAVLALIATIVMVFR